MATTKKTNQHRKTKQANNILELIGNTPILKLNQLGSNLPCRVYAKLEFLNPGGSVKDRIGISMIQAAEEQGLIKPGYTIVEPTSGNTGLGLAMAAIAKGYKMVFTLPDKMSKEKIDLLKAFGAKVIITPTNVPADHPANYIKVAERIVKETPDSFMPNQYFNKANPQAHYKTTGPEIWKQTEGKIDILVASMGTGGTISGTARYLKEKNPEIRVVGVDPEGSIYHHEFYGTQGEVHSYKVEGIGEDFHPSNLDFKLIDEIVTVTDKESFLTARELTRKEGLFTGGSAGAAVFAALQVARRPENKGKLLVVILPDTGRNYLNKIYSDEWMVENGFLPGGADKIAVRDILKAKAGKIGILYVYPEDPLSTAIDLMRTYGVSQLPVIKNDAQVGSLNEVSVMKKLSDENSCSEHTVKDFLEAPLPTVNIDDKLVAPFNFLKSRNAVAVLQDGKVTEIITTIDVINYFLKCEKQ